MRGARQAVPPSQTEKKNTPHPALDTSFHCNLASRSTIVLCGMGAKGSKTLTLTHAMFMDDAMP